MAAITLVLPACTKDRPTAADGGSAVAVVKPAGARYAATITRTANGVPHIVAADLPSVSFGQGWASYDDHACDLADQLVKINGERSKYFGAGDDESNVQSDFAWRNIGIVDRARADWDATPARLKDGLDGFAAGWSAEHAASPTDDWCAGAAWLRPVTGFDIYSYARSIAIYASSVQLLSYLAGAQPPDAATPAAHAVTEVAAPQAMLVSTSTASGWPDPPQLASNGWSIGSERSADGGGMLLANPHFPWEGALRFHEVQLTVPGLLDIYGAQLSGLPFVGIGFNQHIAWTHTVSAGHRFTVYKLALQPGSPTTYLLDGAPHKMTSHDVTIEVKGIDGKLAAQTRTQWSSEQGPILDFPGVGWSDSTTLALRDANIDNKELLGQFLDMGLARSLDEFKAAHATHQGVPLFNTIAVDDQGHSWYADTSATPNLSPEAIAKWQAAKETDPFTKTAASSSVVLLDGSDSGNDWVVVPGARDPGLVPYSEMPKTDRTDYLFNANDSFWMSNADHPLSGAYSAMHGDQEKAVSMRTRENGAVLRDTSADGPSGADGKFSLEELQAAALGNSSASARFGLKVVQAWCAKAPKTLEAACAVLAGWDGRFDLDSVGAVLWREFWSARPTATPDVAFDAARPIDTPVPNSSDATIQAGLNGAVAALGTAGVAIDATLRSAQTDGRVDTATATATPIHGGQGGDGVTNVVDYDSDSTTLEPRPDLGEPINPRTNLVAGGYRVNYGSSFIMAVDFAPGGPQARSILTYGETEDRTDPHFTDQTKMFSAKQWKTVDFTAADVERNKVGDTITVSG